MKYFAYGSNINPERMISRGINYKTREQGTLKDYIIKFNKVAQGNPKIGYANIVDQKGSKVEGAIYEVSESDIKFLDKFEGYPNHYFRQEMVVFDNNEQPIKSIVYIAVDEKIKDGLKPTRGYLNHILKGHDIMTPDYFNKMKNVKTLNEL